MKIVLTNAEKIVIRTVVDMIGFRRQEASVAITSITKTDTETTIEVSPDFVVDYVGLFSNVAPMLKGLYHQAIGMFAVIENLGNSLDKKWAKPIQREVEL